MHRTPDEVGKLEQALAAALGDVRRGDAGRFQAALEVVVRTFEARTATLHRKRAGEERLQLVASLGLPEKLLAAAGDIPFGKGMAGLCAVRREPVTVCNLQTDSSGCARPAARETGVAGAVVVPILTAAGELAGTLGIGKPDAHDYTPAELEALAAAAGLFARALAESGERSHPLPASDR